MDLLATELEIRRLLLATNTIGGFTLSFVCTEQGLLVASSSQGDTAEIAAGLTSLFNDIAIRAVTDLGLQAVDELTLVGGDDRFVVRPIPGLGSPRLYLVAVVPRDKTWRQHTNSLCRRVAELVGPLRAALEEPSDAA